MSFNPDPIKQAMGVTFRKKAKEILHSQLISNNHGNNVIQTTSQKHLGIILDTQLSFEKYLKTVLCKISKTIVISVSCRISSRDLL